LFISDLPLYVGRCGSRQRTISDERFARGGIRHHEVDDLPESIRFLFILACIGGAIYAAMWALSTYPPEQSEIIKELPSEKFRQ
jgi:hypothetical protein